MGKKECVKYNELGDCIEFRDIGDRTIAIFKEEAQACNPNLYDKWKRLVEEDKLGVMK